MVYAVQVEKSLYQICQQRQLEVCANYQQHQLEVCVFETPELYLKHVKLRRLDEIFTNATYVIVKVFRSLIKIDSHFNGDECCSENNRLCYLRTLVEILHTNTN